MNDCDLFVGKLFPTLEAVKSAINAYEANRSVQLYKPMSLKVSKARERGTKRYIKEELEYYEIVYKCIHGEKCNSLSTGQRPNQSTYKQGCPFHLLIRVSADGNSLEVMKLVEDHNHAYGPELYSLLPRQRQLNDSEKEVAKHLLSLGANKKLVQAEIYKTTSKRVCLKDIHNIAAKTEDDSLLNALQYLKGKNSNIVEMVVNKENVLLGLFYQDFEMQRMFSVYPEIVFVDAIYKVSNLRIPLFIFAIEDGNGETEIVAFFLATTEDRPTITQMVQVFKCHNPAWPKIRAIMADKDLEERSAFQEEMPQASLLICLFHVLRTFRRELTTEKRGITSGERDMCLDIVQKMAYSKSEEKYQVLYEELQSTHLSTVIKYFDDNWHTIRNQWVIYLQETKTLGNRTNNRLESINSKVVQVVQKHSRLPDLFKNLDVLVWSLCIERDNIAAITQLCVKLNVGDEEVQKRYLNLLTPYAYSLVLNKLQVKDEVKFEGSIHEEVLQVASSQGLLKVSDASCSCHFFKSYGLHGHHILKLRELKKLSLFCEQLVGLRWTKAYYISSSHLAIDKVYSKEPINSTRVIKSRRILSEQEKFKVVSLKIKKITSLASEAPSRLFSQRLKVLEQIVDFWESNTEISVYPITAVELVSQLDNLDVHSDPVPDEILLAAEEELIDSVPMTEQLPNSIVLTPQHDMADNVSNSNLIPNEIVLTPRDEVASVSLTEHAASSNLVQNEIVQTAVRNSVTLTEHTFISSMIPNDIVLASPQFLMPSTDHTSISNVVADENNLSKLDLDNLPILPPKMKVIGRPKGKNVTVCGLPKRKTERISTFLRKHPKEKDHIMLGWFVSEKQVKKVMDGDILEKEDLKTN